MTPFTNTPITPITPTTLITLIADRHRAHVCWAIVRCSATGLVLLWVGVTVCIIMHIMYSISSTHCDHTPSSSCALFSTDLAPLNRAFNPHNTQTLSTDLAINLPKCAQTTPMRAQNALECPLPQALPHVSSRLLLTLRSHYFCSTAANSCSTCPSAQPTATLAPATSNPLISAAHWKKATGAGSALPSAVALEIKSVLPLAMTT